MKLRSNQSNAYILLGMCLLLTIEGGCGGLLGLDNSSGSRDTGGAANSSIGGSGSGGNSSVAGSTTVGDCPGVATDLSLDAGLVPSCKWVAWNALDKSGSCDFVLPTSTTGSPYDWMLISVYLFPPVGTAEQVPQVETLDNTCMDAFGGFVLDNSANPTRVSLCPCTCSRSRLLGGRIEILLSCGMSGP